MRKTFVDRSTDRKYCKIFVIEPFFSGFAYFFSVGEEMVSLACEPRYTLLSSQDVVDLCTGVIDQIVTRMGSTKDWEINLEKLKKYVVTYLAKNESYRNWMSQRCEDGKCLQFVINIYRSKKVAGYIFSSDASFGNVGNEYSEKVIGDYCRTLIEEDLAVIPSLEEAIEIGNYADLQFAPKYFDN